MFLLTILEIVGTIAFAISGALVAIRKELDYYGIIFLAITTAVGGGIIRDIIVSAEVPVSLSNPIYVLVSIVSAVGTIIFYNHIKDRKNIIQFFDALGLGAFTAIGAGVAVRNGQDAVFIVITMGVFTGIGGGILRDVFVRDIPFVFKKDIYAVASIIGGSIYYFVDSYWHSYFAAYACFAAVFVIRMISVMKNLNLGVVKDN